MKGMRILLLVLLMNLPIISKAFSPVDSIGVENVKGANFIRHQIGDGEGWYSIARKYGISYSELRLANKEKDDKLKKRRSPTCSCKSEIQRSTIPKELY